MLGKWIDLLYYFFHYSIFLLQGHVLGMQLFHTQQWNNPKCEIPKCSYQTTTALHCGGKMLLACSIKMQVCQNGILTIHKIRAELRRLCSSEQPRRIKNSRPRAKP